MSVTAVTSRRSFLSAVAGVAILPATAASPAKAVYPDDALLAYGRELDLCIHDYKTTCAKYRPLWNELSSRLHDELPKSEDGVTLHERIYDEVGLKALDEEGEHPDDILNRSDAPSRAILAIPATTLAGLAVKARLAKFGASQIWDKSNEDADWDHLILRNLVDAVLELAMTQANGSMS